MSQSYLVVSFPSAVVLAVAVVISVVIFTYHPFNGTSGPAATVAAVVSTAPQVAAQQPAAAAPAKVANLEVGHFDVLGKDTAPVTIIEFADFRCPFCDKLHKDVISQLKKEYVDTGKVKFAYRQYAFLGPASTLAANAAECAQEQGKFWPFHDYLFDNQPPESDTTMYTVENMTTAAKSLGLNGTQFQSCLSANKFTQRVTDDFTAGQAAGVQGTPATFVNGQLLSGAQPYASFKALIDQELAKAGK